jgi:hypothetical protein
MAAFVVMCIVNGVSVALRGWRSHQALAVCQGEHVGASWLAVADLRGDVLTVDKWPLCGVNGVSVPPLRICFPASASVRLCAVCNVAALPLVCWTASMPRYWAACWSLVVVIFV